MRGLKTIDLTEKLHVGQSSFSVNLNFLKFLSYFDTEMKMMQNREQMKSHDAHNPHVSISKDCNLAMKLKMKDNVTSMLKCTETKKRRDCLRQPKPFAINHVATSALLSKPALMWLENNKIQTTLLPIKICRNVAFYKEPPRKHYLKSKSKAQVLKRSLTLLVG